MAGFDIFLRSNCNRPDVPVCIWGPTGAAEVIQHRLCGVTWNLTAGEAGEFLVTKIDESSLRTFRFLTSEGFAVAHSVNEQPRSRMIVHRHEYWVECLIMDHSTPSIAYCVRQD